MRSVVLCLLVTAAPAAAQDTLHLPALQQSAVRQDPRLRQVALEETAAGLRLRSMAVERLPALMLTGQASRQSEVAEVPIDVPNVEIPAPPKERYQAALGAEWLLFDGGALGARRDEERARLAARHAALAAELYPLRMEVLEAFFAALVLQERTRESAALIEDLEARLSEVRDQVRAGAALPADTATVRAGMLRAMQQGAEVASDRAAALAVLDVLTGRGISDGDVLAIPDLDAEVARVRAASAPAGREPEGAGVPRVHPRYAVFAAQRESLDRQAAVVRARARPRLSAFGELAYGRPGLQQFTEDFHDYWLAGLRFQWTPWNWGTMAREVETLRIERQIIETEEAAFSERLARQVQQPLHAMERLRAAIEMDRQIIALREQVERQARVSFAERAITAAAYVDVRTDLQEARIALLRHRAELARAQAQYLTTLGVDLH